MKGKKIKNDYQQYITALDYQENIYALFIAIMSPKPISVEQAFARHKCGGIRGGGRITFQYTEADTIDMLKIRNSNIAISDNGEEVNREVTLKEIGEMYGLTESAVFHRISKYCRKHRLDSEEIDTSLKKAM